MSNDQNTARTWTVSIHVLGLNLEFAVPVLALPVFALPRTVPAS